MALGSFTSFGSNQDVSSAIKQPEYDNLILELNDYVDKLEVILRDTEMKMHDTKDYFKGEVGDAVRDKFEKYSVQFDLLINNLLSYSSDLMKIKEGLAINDKNLETMLLNYGTGLKAEAEKINEQ